jgi:hypothetical protein
MDELVQSGRYPAGPTVPARRQHSGIIDLLWASAIKSLPPNLLPSYNGRPVMPPWRRWLFRVRRT